LFVYSRLQRGSTKAADAHVAALEAAGHPVIRLDLADRPAIGGEFFRWQFAIATAASIIGVNPFDEPDVTLAKDRTRDATRKDKRAVP
jgi:hypothetical protein